jgi:hypothetical protein
MSIEQEKGQHHPEKGHDQMRLLISNHGHQKKQKTHKQGV